MSWLFSRALVGAFSAGTCSDGEPSVPSNSTATPQAYWSPDKTKDTCPRFPSGMTREPLTADRGQELLTLYLAGFHARTSVPLEQEKESTESVLVSGAKWHGSFAKYDRELCLWKTRQCSLLAGLDEFSETWPKWGLMLGGAAYRLPTPFFLREIRAYITAAKESGLRLPTPRSQEPGRTSNGYGRGLAEMLEGNEQIERLSTPRASDGKKGGPNQHGSKGDLLLQSAVARLATPTARDWKSGKASQATMEHNSRPLSEQIGGKLNPMWVEWLMGWPIGWTGLEPLETDKFQQWLSSHTKC